MEHNWIELLISQLEDNGDRFFKPGGQTMEKKDFCGFKCFHFCGKWSNYVLVQEGVVVLHAEFMLHFSKLQFSVAKDGWEIKKKCFCITMYAYNSTYPSPQSQSIIEYLSLQGLWNQQLDRRPETQTAGLWPWHGVWRRPGGRGLQCVSTSPMMIEEIKILEHCFF